MNNTHSNESNNNKLRNCKTNKLCDHFFVQSTIAKYEEQKKRAIADAGYNDPSKAAGLSDVGIKNIEKDYDDKIEKAKNDAGHIIGMQLFSKEVVGNPEKPKISKADADNALKLIDATQEKDSRLKQIDNLLSGSNRSALNFNEASDLQNEKQNILNQYNKRRIDIKNQREWDNTRLGVEYEALLGDKQAVEDKRRIEQGLPINPRSKLKYDIAGAGVIDVGIKNASANGQSQVFENVKPHEVDSDKIEKDNQQVFNDERTKAIGEAMYNDKNPIQLAIGAIVPQFKPTKEQVEEYGKKLGYTQAAIDKINPDDIATQSTLLGQATKGAIDAAGSMYELPFRAAAGVGLANKEAVNERFKEGWTGEHGLGKLIANNAPQSQSSGVMGVLGQMANTLGNLQGLSEVSEGAGAVLKSTNLLQPLSNVGKAYAEFAPEEHAAKVAEKASDYGFKIAMFSQGYNDAYKNAETVIGDKDDPIEEAKRQAYAILNGIGTTALFSIDPKIGLIKNLLPENTSKEIINVLAKEGLGAFENKAWKNKFITGIQEAAKENGKQVSLAVAAQVFTNIENGIASKENKYSAMDNVEQTAMSTAVSMLIPSLIHGIARPNRDNPLNYQLMYEVGTNPEMYRKQVTDAVESGRMPEADGHTALEAIDRMSGIVKNIPKNDGLNNVPLTELEKQKYAWLEMKEKTLNDRKVGLPEGDVRIKIIDNSIKQVSILREELLKKTGERADQPIAPVVTEETPESEKKVETNKETEENIIPLESKKVEPKTEQDGKEESNGQSPEEHRQEQRPDTEVHSEENGSKRDEGEEGNRLLSQSEEPATETKVQEQGAETPPALPISENEQPKRKRPKPVEEVETPAKADVVTEEHPIINPETKANDDLEIKSPIVELPIKNLDEEVRKHQEEPQVVSSVKIEPAKGETESTIAEGENIASEKEQPKQRKVKKLSQRAQEEANKLIGKYNAAHGRQWQPQVAMIGSAQRRVDAFPEKIKKYTKGSESYKKIVDSHEAAQVFLAHTENKPPKRSKKNQSKIGDNVSARNKERDELLKRTPYTIEEYIMQRLLGLSDNRPEDKFSKKSVGGNFVTKEKSTERQYANQFVHSEGKVDVDQWANEIADEAKTDGVPLKLDDPQEITNILYPLLTNFETKAELQQHLKYIFEQRDNQEREAAEAYQNEEVALGHLGMTEDEFHNSIDDDRRYEYDKSAEYIHEGKITEDDAKVISEYFDSITDKDGNIDLEHPNANPWSEISQKVYDKLSEQGSYLFASIIDAEHAKQLEENQLKKDKNGTAETESGTVESKSDNRKSESADVGIHNEEGDEEHRQARAKEIEHSLKESDDKIAKKKAEIAVQEGKLKSAEEKLKAAKKTGNDEAVTKAIKSYNDIIAILEKKDRALELLESDHDNLLQQQKENDYEDTVKEKYQKIAEKIRAFRKKVVKDENMAYGSFIPGLTPKNVGKFLDDIANIVERCYNLHIAISRAISNLKLEHPEEKISAGDINKIREALSVYENPVKSEPVLNIANEEYAKDIIADINRGMSIEEGLNEVANEEGLSDATKGKIANYIEWHTSDKYTHRQEQQFKATQSENPLSKSTLRDGGETSVFLGAQTTKAIAGEKGYWDDEDEAKNKLVLNDIVLDAHDFVNLYKNEDIPISQWGYKMMTDIKSQSNDPMKQSVALTGLHGESQVERLRIESEIDGLNKKIKEAASQEDKDNLKAKKATLVSEYKKVKGLIAEVQNVKKKILSQASDILNIGRVDAMITGKLMTDQYEKAIIAKKQAKYKKNIQEKLNEPIAENAKPKERNVEDEAKASKERKAKEEKPAEKAKNVVQRMKDKITENKRKERYNSEKEKAQKDFGLSDNGERMTPEQYLEHIKKLKNPC